VVTLMASITQPWTWTSFAAFGYAYLAFFIVPLLVYELWVEKRGDLLSLTKTGWGWRTLFYSAVLFLLLFFPPPSPNEFVYFRF
jgi:alginate O-acetyltransferase complex protein AlgI